MARILILIENLSVPTFDRRVWQESLALRDAGHEVVVICPKGSTADTSDGETVEGIEIHRYDLRAATGRTAQSWMSNAKMITDLIMDGVCERFPTLNFVSVESGFGWIPFLIEGLDWQWRNYNGPQVSGGLLPSALREGLIDGEEDDGSQGKQTEQDGKDPAHARRRSQAINPNKAAATGMRMMQ